MDEKYQEIDLRELFNIVKKRWWIISIVVLVAVSASFVVSYFLIDPVYRAETSLFLGKEKNTIGSINLGDLQVSNQLVIDYEQMIKSRTIAENVIDELNLDMTPSALQSKITVTTVSNSRLFKIGFESTDPKQAQLVVQSLAK